MMRLGVLGGTFNPVHLGHLLLAETARETLALDRVLFVPTARPPHKRAPDLLGGAARMTLLRLATRGHPAFQVSNVELRRAGVSYTVETLRLLRRRFPRSKLFLLVGQDVLAVPWRSWKEIVALATIAAARRPGAPTPRRPGPVVWLDMPPVAITSSEIRRRIRRGRSIRYLIPEAVARHITRHRFYQAGRPNPRTGR